MIKIKGKKDWSPEWSKKYTNWIKNINNKLKINLDTEASKNTFWIYKPEFDKNFCSIASFDLVTYKTIHLRCEFTHKYEFNVV